MSNSCHTLSMYYHIDEVLVHVLFFHFAASTLRFWEALAG